MPANGSGALVEVEECGPATVVRVMRTSLLDEGEVRALAGCLAGVLDLAGGRPLVLDLGRVENLGSSAVGALVALHRRAQAAGARLTLCGLAGQPARVVENLRLARFLRLCGDRDEAVRGCEARQAGSL
jgi:anti-anti-sigma factor